MKTEIFNITSLNEKAERELKKSAEVIQAGGLVVFPTETVYGLGADATNAEAAQRIYTAKGRPSDNPLIIHVAQPKDAEKYAYTNEMYYLLAEKFMPGPLTVIMIAKDSVPRTTRGGLDTVAVRCPQNIIARKFIEYCGVPIAAPSANLSGSPSPTNASHVIDDMLGKVNVIINGGDSDFGLESTIVKIDENDTLTLLRPGAITVEDLLTVASEVCVSNAVTHLLKEGETPLSPGMKYRHYAPKSSLVLLDGNLQDAVTYIKKNSSGMKIGVVAYTENISFLKENLLNASVYDFGSQFHEVEQAHRLFSILRESDKDSLDVIYAPLPSKEGIGLALYNRMIRAAAHKIIKL